MKSSKVSRFLRLLIVVMGLLFTFVCLPRWLHPGSYVSIGIPSGKGILTIDGITIPQAEQPVFLTPGKHELVLRLNWHAPFRLSFPVRGSWLPIGHETIIVCTPICPDPESTLIESLYQFSLANSPLFKLPRISFGLHEMELAAQASKRNPGTHNPVWSQGLEKAWLAQAWVLCTGQETHRDVLAAASYLSTGSSCSPFGPVYLMISAMDALISHNATAPALTKKKPASMVSKLVSQADWADFLAENPQWTPRQRPVLVRSGLVDPQYLIDYEDSLFAPMQSQARSWQTRAIQGISLAAAQAYADWFSRRTGQPYRLPEVSELKGQTAGDSTDLEWTSSTWQRAPLSVESSRIWKLAYCIAIKTGASGKLSTLILPRNSSSADQKFRLIQQIED